MAFYYIHYYKYTVLYAPNVLAGVLWEFERRYYGVSEILHVNTALFIANTLLPIFRLFRQATIQLHQGKDYATPYAIYLLL